MPKEKNQISKKIKPIETARIIQSMNRSLDTLSYGPLSKKELIDTKDQFLRLIKTSVKWFIKLIFD